MPEQFGGHQADATAADVQVRQGAVGFPHMQRPAPNHGASVEVTMDGADRAVQEPRIPVRLEHAEQEQPEARPAVHHPRPAGGVPPGRRRI